MELDYQLIVDKLQSIIPAQWERAVFMAEYTAGSYSMRCFSDCGNGTYQDCMLISGSAKVQIIKLFKEIDKEIQNCRKELVGDMLWYAVTLKFDKDGKFKAEYDYEAHDEHAIEYIENWKKAYLK